ncbi:MAG: glycosyl transferase [Clostridium sp.]|nr:glycosyl transferase [Clostridium sp.]
MNFKSIKKMMHKCVTMPGRIPMNIMYYSCMWLNKRISDKSYLKFVYWVQFRKKLNIDNPKTFNEKLNWIKLYDRNPMYTKLVDKYSVREYIGRVLGEEYCVPLIGVYDSFDEINFDALPNQFVIKTNHDSAGYVICRDKSKFDIDAARKKINKHIKRNYYWMGREWPYKDVVPKVIIEKYMQNGTDRDLNDWKFYCTNGEPFLFYTTFERSSENGLSMNYYSMDGERIPVRHCNYPNYHGDLKLPANFEHMIEITKVLSKGIPFVRVDLYEINGQVYFGEMTFFPGNGIEGVQPESYDDLWGSYIKLPHQ